MSVQVLLVEDSRAMRDFVSSILEEDGGFVVQEVENGFEALRVLPRGDFSLIITDINMPDVSGIELINFVRKSPRHARTPVVAISTEAASVDAERAMKVGATRFLAKPFTEEALLAAVREALGQEASS